MCDDCTDIASEQAYARGVEALRAIARLHARADGSILLGDLDACAEAVIETDRLSWESWRTPDDADPWADWQELGAVDDPPG